MTPSSAVPLDYDRLRDSLAAAGAVVALAELHGGVCGALCKRIGPRWGCRLPAFVSLLLVAVLLVAGAKSPHPYVAVALLSLCFGFTQFAEGPFWAASTYVAGPNTASATGVLNTGGNGIGMLAPILTPILGAAFGWHTPVIVACVVCGAGGLLWLGITSTSAHGAEPVRADPSR